MACTASTFPWATRQFILAPLMVTCPLQSMVSLGLIKLSSKRAAAATIFITEPGKPASTMKPVGKPTCPVLRSDQKKIVRPVPDLACASDASSNPPSPNIDFKKSRLPMELPLPDESELKIYVLFRFYKAITIISQLCNLPACISLQV